MKSVGAVLPPKGERFPLRTRVRQIVALTRKELALQTSRTGVWTLQTGFLLLLAIGVALITADQMDRPSVEQYAGPRGFTPLSPAEALGSALGTLVYFGLLLLGPLLAAGALDEERERGTAELFLASPARPRDLAIAVIVARLLVSMQFLVCAIPVLLIPTVAAGWGYFDVLGKAIAVSLFASLVSTLYSLNHSANGLRTHWSWFRLILYLTCTPLGVGLRGFGLYLLFTLCLIVIPERVWGFSGGAAVFAIYLPFVSLGQMMGGVIPLPLSFLHWCLASLALHLFVWGFAFRRSLPRWLDRQVVAGGHRESRARQSSSDGIRARLEGTFVARRARGDAEPDGDPPVTSVSFRPPDSRVGRGLLALTRGNVFLLKELRHPSVGPGWSVLGGLFVFFTMIFASGDRQVAETPTILGWTGLLVIILFAVIAAAGARILPAGRGAKSFALLLASPLTGRQVVVGAIAIGILRTLPLFLALVGWNVIRGLIDDEFELAVAALFLAASWLFLVGALSTWASVIGRATSQKVGGTILVTLVLGSGVIPWFPFVDVFFEGSLWEPKQIGAGAVDVLALGVVLYLAYALMFDRMTGRVRGGRK